MKRWLYVVQQRLAITNTEATALLTVGFLLVAGLIVGEVRSRMVRFTDETYARSDRLVREGALAAAGGIAIAPTDSVSVPDTAGSSVSLPKPKARGGALVLDLNTASESELELLPRIGPALAARIVAFRVENGPFRTLNELMAVKGIGQATYARLVPHLRIGPTKDDAESDSLR